MLWFVFNNRLLVKKSSAADIVIALDAMGGDHAPFSVLDGAARAAERYPGLRYIVFGDGAQITPYLAKFPTLAKISTLHHTPDAIASDMKPSAALRQGKNSSMRLAIDAVQEKKAHGMVSAGNTGALMAMAKMVLRTLPGIDRPAIGSLFPTLRGQCVLLDLGANIECSAANLFQFAIMGHAFARAVLGLQTPSVGLLNVGEEEMKGHESVRSAYAMLKQSGLPLQFYGYVEGNDIAEGTTDVVVTDGFTGNIALKTAEGTGKICRQFLKEAFTSSLFSRLGALLAKRSLKTLFNRVDPRLYNGAMFLGLNGIAVKSHGSADGKAFANAIGVSVELAVNGVNERITEELAISVNAGSQGTSQ